MFNKMLLMGAFILFAIFATMVLRSREEKPAQLTIKRVADTLKSKVVTIYKDSIVFSKPPQQLKSYVVFWVGKTKRGKTKYGSISLKDYPYRPTMDEMFQVIDCLYGETIKRGSVYIIGFNTFNSYEDLVNWTTPKRILTNHSNCE